MPSMMCVKCVRICTARTWLFRFSSFCLEMLTSSNSFDIGGLEVLAALRQRPLDEGDQVLGGLGHLDAGLLEGRDLALVGAERALADDGAGMAHARAARKDVLGADAGDAGDDRLGILGLADVAGGLLLVVAAHLAHENHQLRAIVVAHQFEQILEVDAGDAVAADADDDAACRGRGR